MTIAHDAGSPLESGADPFDAAILAAHVQERTEDDLVPLELRADRLTRQIESFVRGGYLLETRTALQAVVVKPPVERGPLARVAAASLRALGLGRGQHRVVITVDRSGAVRFV